MSPIRRGGILYLYVPRQSGGRVLRTTQTSDLRVYRGMKNMLADLKDGRRHWPLLAAMDDGRLSIAEVYDAYVMRKHDALQATLSAAGLAPLMDKYLVHCRTLGLAPLNMQNIRRQLKHFLAFAPSKTTADLTTSTVNAWLATLTVSTGTARQYLYAVTGFTRYLVSEDVLDAYPLDKVVAPDKNASRERYESAAVDTAIVRAASPEFRGLFAFIKGTGVDLTVALQTIRRDIDTVQGRARLKGTKTFKRDVHNALIEAWALPFVREALADVTPNVKPWSHITRSRAAKHHAACCAAVKVEGYTLRDARHSVAVRMMTAGYTVMEIAEQLGNSPELVSTVYAFHTPKMERKDDGVIPKTITSPAVADRREGTTNA